MAIQGFDYKEQVLGTGDATQYTFDFLIQDPTHLLIWVQDSAGKIVGSYRGDDITFLAGLIFDAKNGGGTVTLVSNLADAYVMTMFLANDAPDQPSSFPNKFSFTLEAIEAALDYIASWGQRIAYLAQRSVKMHDVDDIDLFDPTLPVNPAGNPGGVLSVKTDGTGFEFAVTTQNIIAVTNSTAAASAAAAAASAATAASLVAGVTQTFNILNNQSATLLAGLLFDGLVYTSAILDVEITRGTTVFNNAKWIVQYLNGTWQLVVGPDEGNAHGVTLTLIAQVGSVIGLNYATDNGAGAGKLKIRITSNAA